MDVHANEGGIDWMLLSLFFHPTLTTIFVANEESQNVQYMT